MSRRLITRFLFALGVLLACASAFADGERIYLIDLQYHTADGAISPIAIKEAQWPYKLPAPTAEDLAEAANSNEQKRRNNGRGLVYVEAISADGKVLFQSVEPIYIYETLGDTQEVTDPKFRVRVPADGTARVHIKGWRATTEITLDVAATVRAYSRATTLATTPELPAMANRINVLIMAEGYVDNATQRTLFDNDFTNVLNNGLRDISPISSYWNYFNFQKKFFGAPANTMSGVIHPQCPAGVPLEFSDHVKAQKEHPEIVPTPYWGTSYCRGTPQAWGRVLPADQNAILAKAEELMPGVNLVILLMNDFTWDGRLLPFSGGVSARREAGSAPGLLVSGMQRIRQSGVPLGQPATLSTDSGRSGSVMVHEIGHCLFHLADEYFDLTPADTCSDAVGSRNPCEENVTDLATHAKWGDWSPADANSVKCDYNSQIFLPTEGQLCESKPGYLTTIGLFEGARYQPKGMYRPMYTCRMKKATTESIDGRFTQTQFCSVCKEAIIRRIYRTPAATGAARSAGIDLHDKQPNTNHTVPPLAPEGNPLPISMAPGQTKHFEITPVVPVAGKPSPFQFTWVFYEGNESTIGTNLNCSVPKIDFTAQKSGVLELQIVEPTPSEPRPFTTGPAGPLVLPTHRVPGMFKIVHWGIQVEHSTSATSAAKDIPIENYVDVPVTRGTSSISITYGIKTQEFANRCASCGDHWQVIVTPLPGSGITATANTVIFEKEGIAGVDSSDFTKDETFSVASLTANGDITLRLTLRATSLGDDQAPTTVNAKMGGIPGEGCVTCDICSQTPKPPECGLSLSILSSEFLPITHTDGDGSYVSFEPSGSYSEYERYLRIKTNPIPADATLKATVYVVNDKGEDAAIAVTGTYPTDKWPLRKNNDALSDWNLRVTQHDNKDLHYLGKPIGAQFTYRVNLLLTRGTRSVEANTIVGSIVSGDAPGLPPKPRPLHALFRSAAHDRYAPVSGDREAGGDNWISDAASHWFNPIADYDRFAGESAKIITRMDDISLEHALADPQHPWRHQYGTDISIYAFHQFPNTKIDAGTQYKKLREYAQNIQSFVNADKNREATEQLKAWTAQTRIGLQRLIDRGQINRLRFALGGICPGNTDPNFNYVDNLPDDWIRQLLWNARVLDKNGAGLFDLGLGFWGTTGPVEYTCEANFESDVILDRCLLGETPPPCNPKRRAVGQPSLTKKLNATTMATLGQEVTLAVTAIADEEAPAYRWYRGFANDFSTPVPDSNSPSYKFTASGPDRYWVYVYNSAGSASSATEVVICTKPQITGQPTYLLFKKGQSGDLNVSTSGSDPRTFEWFTGVNGPLTPIPGSDTSLTITPTVDTTYWMRVSNACGTATTQPMTIEVCDPAKVSTPPQPTTIIGGNRGSLAILATGSDPITYEWFRGALGDTSNKETRCNGNVCLVEPTETSDYWVRVSNKCGTDQSGPVTVTVVPPCTPPTVSAQPQPQTIDKDQEAVLNVTAGGTTPHYQWYAGGRGDTQNPVTGAQASELRIRPAATTTYWVRITNSCGTIDSEAAKVTVNVCDPVSIAVQPAGATIEPGGSATLRVTASGTGPITYQWYRFTIAADDDDELLDGADSDSYTFSPTSNGLYYVIVDNACGPEVRSNFVFVNINQTCKVPSITADPVPYTLASPDDQAHLEVRASGTQPFTYQWYVGTSPDTSRPLANEISPTLNITPLATTTYWVRVSNDCGSDDSAAATVTVPVACDLHIAFQPSSNTILQGQTQTLLGRGEGSGTVTHQWYSAEPGGAWQPIQGETSTKLDVTPNTTTYYFIRATNQCAYVDSEIAVLTVITGCTRPAIITQPQSITTSVNAPVTLTVNADGTAPLSYQWYEVVNGFENRIFTATDKSYSVAPTLEGRTYHVRVTNACFTTVSVDVVVKLLPPCSAPTVETQPQSKTITNGQSVTLAVVAGGTGPFSYQWYRGTPAGDWTEISGATGAERTETPGVTTYYYVHITNGCGEVSSSYAIVTVNASGGGSCTRPPLINAQPGSMTISAGAPASLSVLAQQVDRYQWYRSDDGVNGWVLMEGQTQSSITVYPTATTYYFARLTNNCGTVDTWVASVTVTAACVPPQVVWISDVIKFYPGDQISVFITANGTNLHYAWYKSDPAGASSQRLVGDGPVINDYPQSDLVFYWAVVSNECGSVQTGYANARSLTACTIPRVTQQPQGGTIQAGDAITLSVTAEAQTAIEYQWYSADYNYFVWSPVPGATSRTLEVRPPISRYYYVELKTECATVQSDGTFVNVVQP